MKRRLLLATSFLAGTLSAQTPRATVQVNTNPGANSGQISIDSRDDLTAVCWNDATGEEVFVVTSDGRGINWGTPVRVDADSFGKKTELDAVHVSGTNVYVVYESNLGLWFTRSTDSGVTFSAPVSLDVGPGPITDWAVAMSPDDAGDHLYVLCSTKLADDDLFLTSSHDSGASFGSAVSVEASDTSGDVDELDIGSSGNVVHVAWDDNRSGADTVYYQRSIDGGATFLAADIELGDAVGVEDSAAPLRIAVRGNTVAAVWNEEPSGSGNEVIQANVSTNAGVTFSGPKTVGNYPLTADTEEGDVGIDHATGNVIVAWEDDRFGADRVFATASNDGGATWLTDTQLSTFDAEKPRVAAGGRGTVVAWEETIFPRSAEASLTMDGGATWGQKVAVSDNPTDSADFVSVAWGDRYDNFVHAWTELNTSDINVHAGGFRPQTLAPQGWVVGATSVSFDLERFDPAFGFGGVLLSSAPGTLPLPFGDGRDVGLLFDGLFLTSINLAFSSLGAAIGSGGTGSTPQIPLTLPVGFAFYAVGYQFDFSGGVKFGALTDVTALAP